MASNNIKVHFEMRASTGILADIFILGSLLTIPSFLQRIVSSTLGKADNERFLEHFRYIIIASQLLNEHVGAFSHTSSEQSSSSPSLNPGTIFGALVSTVLAFGLVCSIQWTRDANSSSLRTTRILIVFIIQSLVALSLYAYVRRHWLKFLRSQAVEAATKFVHEMQSFESSSASIVKQIQEIEIVSRGYQMCVYPSTIKKPIVNCLAAVAPLHPSVDLRVERNHALVSVYAAACRMSMSALYQPSRMLLMI